MTLALASLIVAAQLAAAPMAAPPAPALANRADAQASQVEVVVYSDFQCPFCATFARPLRALQARSDDRVTFRFKHFPLVIHPRAQLAHQAAVAAGDQDKFWEMHDLLFANPQRVQRDDLVAHAKALELDMDRFLADLDSDRVKQMIDADIAEGSRRRVNGTPTFFVNGKEHVGTKSLAQLEQIVLGEQRRAVALAEITDGLMSRGPEDAPVTLELFADLQSPVSGPAMAVVDHVMRKYPSLIRLQFRNFPLAFHPQAALAHEAAMTAAKEGQFWEFVTYVLGHQDSLREQDLIALAGRLGLDEARFAETIRQHRYAPRVEADVEAGFRRGLRGSPVILVNDTRIDGVPSLETLTAQIDAALASTLASRAVKR